MLLRGRRNGPRSCTLSYGDLVLDDVTCQARRGTRDLALTPAEHRLLRHLLCNAGKLLSKDQMGRHVWGEYRGGNAIEQLVSRLRRKVTSRTVHPARSRPVPAAPRRRSRPRASRSPGVRSASRSGCQSVRGR
ncbi:winged helix-turn-helix domain-containing protein [Streptomyces cavernae]|uniref:winged helix-turn-helix domain-containing protein n=1 Tax=Streptomyces cavernae TaxID=2259034 RepID=UPI003B75CDCF